MTRTMPAVWVMIAALGTAVAGFGWPLSEDTGYGAYRVGPCDRCVPGVRPVKSVTDWLVTATTMQRDAQRPWLRVRVNGRDTDLGRHAVVLDKELMAPVTAAAQFGLTATRSALNHRLLTLAGGRHVVRLCIGSRQAEVNHAVHSLPVAPKWHDGRVYMPLESIGELLGWEFSLNTDTGVLSVNTRGTEPGPERAARAAHARRMYDEAIAEYDAALQRDPGDWRLHRARADALTAKARFNEALAAAHRNMAEALRTMQQYRELAGGDAQAPLAGYREASCAARARLEAYRLLTARPRPLTDVPEPDQTLVVYERVIGAEGAAPPSAADLEEAMRRAAEAASAAEARARESYAAALEGYRAAVERAPAGVAQRVHLAEQYYRSNQPRQAVEEFEKALLIDPEHAAARLELAQSLLALGRLDDAARETRRVLEANPKNAAAHNMLGYVLRLQGNVAEAIEAYKTAIEMDSRFALAYNNLGVAFLRQGKTEEAVATLSKAAQIAPTHADFQANLALALLDSGQDAKAAAAWRRAVELAPDSAECRANLAFVLQRLGDVDGAIVESRAALSLYPRNMSDLREARAQAGAADTRLQAEAREALEAGRLRAQVTLAWALLEKGRMQDAMSAAEAARGLDAQNAGVQAVLAAVHVERLSPAEAVATAEAAVRAEPHSGLHQALAAAAKAMAGQRAEAQEHLDEAMYLLEHGADRWSWYFLGRACAALGLTQEATRAYLQPQPDRHDAVRRQQISEYRKRHPLRKVVPTAQPAPARPRAEQQPAAEPVVTAEIGAEAAQQDLPTLRIVNRSDKYLDVRLEDPGRNTTLWTVPPNEVREADALQHGHGKYNVTVSARAATAGPLRMQYEFQPRRAYTMTVTMPQ